MASVLQIIISAKDQASSVVNGVVNGIKSATQGLNSTLQQLSGTSNSTTQSLMQIGTAVAAIELIRRAFQAGIKEVDDFRLSTIGIAASITDMAAKGTKDFQAFYDNARLYAEDTYHKLELASAKFFASAKEMMTGWQTLVQRGVMITSDDDINNLGIVIDRIKLATKGMDSQVQIAQELRAIMNGTANANSTLAMDLKTKLGPEWKKIVSDAMVHGQLLKLLAGMYKGVGYAAGDIEKTLESQLSTLGTMLSYVARQGLGGAYDDIVSLVKEINDYLKEHASLVADKIRSGWDEVRPIIFGIRDGIKEISAWMDAHPIATDWIKAFGTLSISIAAVGIALKPLIWLFSAAFGPVVALLSGIGTLLAGIVASIGSLCVAVAAVSPVFAAVIAVVGLLSAAIAGISLWDMIKEWEVAGLAIKDWVDLGIAYVKQFYYYIRDDFWNDTKNAFSTLWDAVGSYLKSKASEWYDTLVNFWQKVKSLPSGPYGLGAEEAEGNSYIDEDGVQVNTVGRRGAVPSSSSINPDTGRAFDREANDKLIDLKFAQRNVNKTKESGATGSWGATTPETQAIKAQDEKGKSQLAAAKALATAEFEYAKAVAKHKLALVEDEIQQVDNAYKQQQLSAEQYYTELQRLNDASLSAKIEGIDGEVAAVKKGTAEKLAEAKTEQQENAIRIQETTKLLDLEDQRSKARVEAATKSLDLALKEKQTLQDQQTTLASAVNDYAQLVGSQKQQLEAQKQLALATAEKNALDAKQKGELEQTVDLYRKIGQEQARVFDVLKSDNIWGGFKEGLAEVGRGMQTLGQLGKQVALDLRDSLSTFIQDVTSGTKSFSDSLLSFVNSIKSSLSKLVADRMASGILGSLSGKKDSGSFLDSILGGGKSVGTMTVTAATVNVNGTSVSGLMSGGGAPGTSDFVGPPTQAQAEATQAGTAVEGFGSRVSSVFSSLGNGISSLFSGLFSFLKSGFGSLISGIGSMLSGIGNAGGSVLSGLGSILGFGSSAYAGAGTYGVNPGDINWHAKGDYWFLEPTYAVGLRTGKKHMIGESGPEYLAPTSKGSGVTSNAISTNINVTVNANSGAGTQTTDPKAAEDLGRQVGVIVQNRIDETLTKHLRPGGLLNKGKYT